MLQRDWAIFSTFSDNSRLDDARNILSISGFADILLQLAPMGKDEISSLNEGNNIGLRTGKDFFVVDCDSFEATRSFVHAYPEAADTYYVNTARGKHFYFLKPEFLHIPTSVRSLLPEVDVLASGRKVVVPPSLHSSGIRYRVSSGRSQLPVEASEGLLNAVCQCPPMVDYDAWSMTRGEIGTVPATK